MRTAISRRHFLMLALLAGGSLLVTPRSSVGQDSQAARPDPRRFKDEIARFTDWDLHNSFPRDAVLFVGSSSIRFWNTHEAFPDLPVINRGFGGSHVSDVNHFFDQVVTPYHARVIVFYAGDNDIAAEVSPERVRDDFVDFLERALKVNPKTPVVYLTIKPSGSRWQLWPQMQRANELIHKLTERYPNLRCVDVGTPLLGPDAKPRDELFREDRLHLNAEGYEIWQRTLAPVLKELMAAK